MVKCLSIVQCSSVVCQVLRAIVDCGFEHPSEIQHECIPQVEYRAHPSPLVTFRAVETPVTLSSARPCWGWTSCPRPSPAWARLPCSCWPRSSRLSRSTDRWGRRTLSLVLKMTLSLCQVSVLVMCHTRELAFQISKEYERFSKFLPAVKVERESHSPGNSISLSGWCLLRRAADR